jgi:hypothetical protein
LEKIENYGDQCDELYIIPMGQFPYLCEKCGGGDERCCNESCEEEDCMGGQFCWSESAICVIDDIKLDERYMTKEQMEISQNVYNKWKGKSLIMTYDGSGRFTCQRFPSITFAVDCNGAVCEYGVHVKAWCRHACSDGDE